MYDELVSSISKRGGCLSTSDIRSLSESRRSVNNKALDKVIGLMLVKHHSDHLFKFLDNNGNENLNELENYKNACDKIEAEIQKEGSRIFNSKHRQTSFGDLILYEFLNSYGEIERKRVIAQIHKIIDDFSERTAQMSFTAMRELFLVFQDSLGSATLESILGGFTGIPRKFDDKIFPRVIEEFKDQAVFRGLKNQIDIEKRRKGLEEYLDRCTPRFPNAIPLGFETKLKGLAEEAKNLIPETT